MRSSKTGKALAMRSMQMLILASILLLTAVAAMAQATTGTLKGSVVDANGAVVAGATVTIKNDATGAVVTSITSGDGNFEAASLLPGTYTVTVEGSGFKRSVNTGVSVKVGIINPIDVKLEPGNVNETVTITANTEEIVQRDQSQISATIEARKISDLPSNGAGGGIDTLALLIPGVVANRGGGTNTNGTGLSVNGNRGRTNNFQIDGSDNNDLSVAGPALFVDFQDSVQEFQVVTNNFSAQYGRNQGAVVNIVTKGGTNDFHGTLFEYHQDAFRLNSLNNQERALGQLQPNRSLYNVFGGTVGGPIYLPRFGEGDKSIWKGTNKAFFFFAYQGIRNPATLTGRSTSITPLATEFPALLAAFPGNAVISTIAQFSPFAIPGAVPNNQTAGTTIATQFNLTAPTGCAKAIAVTATPAAGCGSYTTFINPRTGQPFLTGGAFDTMNFGTTTSPLLIQAAQPQRTLPDGYNENYYSYRFDVHPTSKNSITFRVLHQKGVSQNGIGTFSAGITGNIPASSNNMGGSWTRQISSRFVNEARISYNRIGVEFGGGCATGAPSCIPAPSDIGLALANVAFPVALGITKTGSAMNTIGPATNLPQGRVGKVYQYADNLTMTRGKHSFIFGAEYKHLNTIVPFLPNFNGSYSFNSLARIQNNAPNAVSITLGDPILPFKENDQYYFVQDDFKLRSNLTLNLGVRYENTGQPINQLHDVSLARESNASTAFFNPALPLSIRTVPKLPVDNNNFAPRLGFAWSPKYEHGLMHKFVGNDATVIRGGFSIAYDLAYYNILLNVQNGAPFSVALTVPTSSLTSTTTSLAPLPASPTGDVVRASALASGLLPKGVLNPIFLSQVTSAPDFHAPYSEQFSLGVQRQLGRNSVVEARYVGTHGISLFQNLNGNFFIGPLVNGFNLTKNLSTGAITNVASCAGQTNPCVSFPSFASQLPPGTVAQVCVDNSATLDLENACNNRQFRQGGVTERANTSQSIYHSLQTRYNGRFLKNSLNLGMTYTFSKTIDDSSEIFAFADIASANAQNPFCINRCERSLSALDRPHAFSANFIYDVPFFKKQEGIVGHLLGGWQFNGTYVLTSGSPFTPGQTYNSNIGLGNTYLTSGDRPFIGNKNADPKTVGISQIDTLLLFGVPITNPNGFYSLNALQSPAGNIVSVTPADVHYIFNGPGAAKIFGTPFGDSPRNSRRGPILNQLNLSLFKNIKMGERMTFQLRGEAFNALNHPNPGFGTGQGGYLPSINVNAAGVSGGAFDTFTDIAYARRVLQFGARFIF
jgi:outer membrane receptor protein involved in Fe transport